MYTPDRWVVVRITNKAGTFYKVLAGWSSGYLYGDSWRMNSGITKADVFESYIEFHGYSGSKYCCGKNRYGLSTMTCAIAEDMHRELGCENFLVMPEETDWSKIDWGL